MINMSLKNALLIGLSFLSLSIHADTAASKEALALQCRQLADTVASLVYSQEKKACVEKLALAAMQIENAGDLILNDAYPPAKQELDHAVYTLQYAELNSCNRYIQISHSKFEAQKIKNSL